MKKALRTGLLSVALLLALAPSGHTAPNAQPNIVLQWESKSITERVKVRVASLLSQTQILSSLPAGEPCVGPCAKISIRLIIQETGLDQAHTDPESFSLRAEQQGQQTVLTVHGLGRGLMFGTYAALEKLGLRFWHPLQPYIPKKLTVPEPFSQTDSPDYHARGFAHHTMHPLELAHVLNGWGPKGPEDSAGWEGLLPEWERYLEWLIANRQNKVEWVLLEKAPWAEFARSSRRQARLKQMVDLGHDWQMQIGIDAPMALEQQNGWRLIPKTGDSQSEEQQLRRNLDWLAATGVDFLSTEMGTSEFTHGGASHMLGWLNTATAHLADQHKLPFYTKIHISSGQEVKDYRDPETGAPLNVNFLPYYADPRLGIMPHTVQIYAIDDPAPTYGHQDFSAMHRFMRLNQGKRPMLWFPETAYWVNYDIHVPLFLPVYARQRLHDLRLFQAEDLKIDGQILFSSGWEHGYWLNDLIAARAAWDAGPKTGSDRDALQTMLTEIFAPYAEASKDLVNLILDVMDTQHRLLVLGQHGDNRPQDIQLRSGMAYLAGQDSWSQLGSLIRAAGIKGYQTQPDRISFEELETSPEALEIYTREIAPLLRAMVFDFSQLDARAEALQALVPEALEDWYAELAQGLKMNYLRAVEVYALMEASASRQTHQQASYKSRLAQAREAISEAEVVNARQVAGYRANAARIAGQGIPNPTVYTYGYLWPARSLYFWKRDWLQVATGNHHPCLINIIDPLEVALPDPGHDNRAQIARALLPIAGLGDCVHLRDYNFAAGWDQRTE